ncbi:hypothetical protein AB833_24565 [Chromatiales bacterium (ex Bugula neritina AB1)]|nr:hypothetical protein AB833_24565 [Chromatiales bacterium (ex Bugula neritina AB1)]
MILPLLAQIVSMMQQQGSNGNGNHGNGPGYGDGSNQGNGCGCGNPVGVDNCRVWGDPHFVGADGGKYDVQGEAGKTYNILSDQGLQFNALFESWGSKEGATVMSDAGLTVNGNQLHFDKAGTLTVNGEKLGDGSHFGGGVVKDGDTVKITTGEYQVELKAVDGKYLNYDFKSDNVNADGIMPHGLWGQSADGDGEARNGDKGAGAQGGGAIESLNDRTEAGDTSAVGLYETNELWDTGFSNFNRYW